MYFIQNHPYNHLRMETTLYLFCFYKSVSLAQHPLLRELHFHIANILIYWFYIKKFNILNVIFQTKLFGKVFLVWTGWFLLWPKFYHSSIANVFHLVLGTNSNYIFLCPPNNMSSHRLDWWLFPFRLITVNN